MKIKVFAFVVWVINSKVDLSDLTSFFSMGLAGKILVSKGNKKALAS